MLASRCPPPAPAPQALRVIRRETRPAQGRRHLVIPGRRRQLAADQPLRAIAAQLDQVPAFQRRSLPITAMTGACSPAPCPAPSGENPPCHPHQDQHRRPGPRDLGREGVAQAHMAG